MTYPNLPLKKGDACLAVYGARNSTSANRRQVIRGTVTSVGTKLIHTTRGKFDLRGFGEYGWRLFVDEAALLERDEVEMLQGSLSTKVRDTTDLPTLRAIAEILAVKS